MNVVHLTPKSSNSKTGPIPVSTSTKRFCPSSCPLKAGGCYATGGPLALHWAKVTDGERGMSWDAFCGAIRELPEGQLWRHNQAGDLPGNGMHLSHDDVWKLVQANKGRRGFTYTHYPMDDTGNQHVVRFANDNGFTVNLSADTLADADRLADLGIAPVVTLLPIDQTDNTVTPAGRRVVVCPATQRDDVSCATCQLCQRQRDTIVGFPAHGSGKAKAQRVFMLKQQ